MTEIEEQEDRLIKEVVPLKRWFVTRSLGAGGCPIDLDDAHVSHGAEAGRARLQQERPDYRRFRYGVIYVNSQDSDGTPPRCSARRRIVIFP